MPWTGIPGSGKKLSGIGHPWDLPIISQPLETKIDKVSEEWLIY